MKAIIIENETLKVRIVQEYIKKFFLSIDVVTTLDEAYKFCKQNNYHFVFLDSSLPDGNGTMFLSKIKHLLPNSKVISISNNVDILNQCVEFGYDDAFTYPFRSSVARIFFAE